MFRQTATAFLVFAGATAVPAAGQAFLGLAHQAPEIEVEPGIADQGGLRLPELEFHFTVDVRCPDTLQPLSLMISIADTRKRVMKSALHTALESGLSLTVPSRQIAPITLGSFCAVEQTDARAQIVVKGLLSAQGALACGTDGNNIITYASTNLDVRLRCARQAEPDADENGPRKPAGEGDVPVELTGLLDSQMFVQEVDRFFPAR